MADTNIALALLTDGFHRIPEGVEAVVEGLGIDELLWRPDADANHIAWLLWHAARQQDEQVAALGAVDPAWAAQGWADRFGLDYPEGSHGYGMSSAEVGAFRLEDPAPLVRYHEAVHDLTRQVLADFDADAYERVINADWHPPVTVGIRIVSVLDDAIKHLGQAEYVRGLVLRRR